MTHEEFVVHCWKFLGDEFDEFKVRFGTSLFCSKQNYVLMPAKNKNFFFSLSNVLKIPLKIAWITAHRIAF